jgi:hypothetical protein
VGKKLCNYENQNCEHIMKISNPQASVHAFKCYELYVEQHGQLVGSEPLFSAPNNKVGVSSFHTTKLYILQLYGNKIFRFKSQNKTSS